MERDDWTRLSGFCILYFIAAFVSLASFNLSPLSVAHVRYYDRPSRTGQRSGRGSEMRVQKGRGIEEKKENGRTGYG